jgi:ferric-dicitrate binding protein FerR (iron transport regulator)
MIPEEINTLIGKFMNKSADSADLEALNDWIQNPQNQAEFNAYVKTLFAIEMGLNDSDSEKIKKRLLREIRKDKNKFSSKRIRSALKYSAIAILFMAIGYFVHRSNSGPEPEEGIIPKNEAITLQLQNGEVRALSEDNVTDVMDSEGNLIGHQKGKRLSYENGTAKAKLEYNLLKVPFGKRFDITLSDGTTVFLNAGSSIRYPVQFISGTDRTVFLHGEAFFDVVKSERPFIVNVDKISIEVLGTRFNLADYPENRDTEVVLVEGSVQMRTASAMSDTGDSDGTILNPGFKGAYNKTTRDISIKKVNTKIHTSWVEGHVVFRNVSFENIIRKLERLYNVTIVNNNEELARARFNATIETDDETIEKVFDYFSKVYDIDYDIVENKIIVN